MFSFSTRNVGAVAACLLASWCIAADDEIKYLPDISPDKAVVQAPDSTSDFPFYTAAELEAQRSAGRLSVNDIGPIGVERGEPNLEHSPLAEPMTQRLPPVEDNGSLERLSPYPQPLNIAATPAMGDRVAVPPPSVSPWTTEGSTSRWFGPPPLPLQGPMSSPFAAAIELQRAAEDVANPQLAAKNADAVLAQQPLGEAPVDISQIFLRQSSSLLSQGVLQTELGVTYSWQQADAIVVLPDSSIELERVRERALLMPLTARYGWSENLEIFFTLPIGVANFERSNSLENDFTTRGGLGDVSGGFLWQLRKETAECPGLIYSMQGTAPTGSTPYGPGINIAALGSGFWSISSNLNAVKSYDPVVIFGGVGYRHEFENEFDGLTITPGEAFTYSFGMGLSLNDDIAVSAELSGEFRTLSLVDDLGIPNSTSEPILLQFSITRRVCQDRSVQPFVAFGLTDDAPDVFLGAFFIRTRDTRWKCEE